MSLIRNSLEKLSRRIAAITHVRLGWLGLATVILLLLIFYLAPSQFPIVLHKVSLVTLAAVIGYWIDSHLFPYAHPHDLQSGEPRTFQAAMIRRAILVGCTLLSIATGL